MRALVLALPVLALAGTAFAVGSNDETPPTPTETTTACEDGQIYDDDKQDCVTPDTQSLNDDTRFKAVRELAYAGAYDRALGVIAAADSPDNPRFLNYRGFIARKQGRMDAAMGYYTAALDADPDYLLARSYMGMGLAAEGDLTGAKVQLAEISARGGKGTWAYFALKQAITSGPQNGY